jgi:hypothetical protein
VGEHPARDAVRSYSRGEGVSAGGIEDDVGVCEGRVCAKGVEDFAKSKVMALDVESFEVWVSASAEEVTLRVLAPVKAEAMTEMAIC